MIKFRGFIRDLVLVSASAVLAVFIAGRLDSAQTASQLPIDSLGLINESARVDQLDQIKQALFQLRKDMFAANSSINERIDSILRVESISAGESKSLESTVFEAFQRSTIEEKVKSLVQDEEYDQVASERYDRDVNERIAALGLKGTEVKGIDCFDSKCVFKFEHNSAVDEDLFVNNFIFKGREMFSSKMSYQSFDDDGGEGKTMTVLLDR